MSKMCDLIYLKQLVELVDHVSKSSSSYFAASVDQVHAEELPFSPSVTPRADLRLGHDASFDDPVVLIRTEADDRMGFAGSRRRVEMSIVNGAAGDMVGRRRACDQHFLTWVISNCS